MFSSSLAIEAFRLCVQLTDLSDADLDSGESDLGLALRLTLLSASGEVSLTASTDRVMASDICLGLALRLTLLGVAGEFSLTASAA
eukprot:COSAG01_NODE_2360_length_7834_cov_29.886246_6_plen_86_part_00